MMASSDEQVNEAAIMVLGTITDPERGIDHLRDEIPNLVAYLIPKLSSSYFITRSTTVWTLSRFSNWIIE